MMSSIFCWPRFVTTLAAFAALMALFATNAFATDASTEAEVAQKLPERWCRSGAFLDAVVLMNSAIRAHGAASSPDVKSADVARAEMRSIVTIALKQAVDEYHCVNGNLPLSYAKDYGDTVRKALRFLKANSKPSAELVKGSDELIAKLDAANVQALKALKIEAGAK
jgi:hypothetical protein